MKTKTLVLGLIALAVVGIAAYVMVSSSAKALVFADDNSPVMYFYSDSCIHCKEQKPVLQELAKEGYRVKLMDVLSHPEYWDQYQISGTPTFLAANGDKQVGFTQKEALGVWLESHGARIA